MFDPIILVGDKQDKNNLITRAVELNIEIYKKMQERDIIWAALSQIKEYDKDIFVEKIKYLTI